MSDQVKACLTCRWYAPEPSKRCEGVCFAKWVDTLIINTPNGAYERTFSWMKCSQWTKCEAG